MPEEMDLTEKLIERLSAVIDPETGTDVIRVRLIEDILIDPAGKVSYVFRPSSPLCPLAVPLALSIIQAVAEVPGISGQDITVVDYVQAEQLNQLLKGYLEQNEQVR